MPDANSSPASPFCCAKDASFASDTPASAYMAPSGRRNIFVRFSVLIMNRSFSPSSGNRIFVPLPSSSGEM